MGKHRRQSYEEVRANGPGSGQEVFNVSIEHSSAIYLDTVSSAGHRSKTVLGGGALISDGVPRGQYVSIRGKQTAYRRLNEEPGYTGVPSKNQAGAASEAETFNCLTSLKFVRKRTSGLLLREYRVEGPAALPCRSQTRQVSAAGCERDQPKTQSGEPRTRADSSVEPLVMCLGRSEVQRDAEAKSN